MKRFAFLALLIAMPAAAWAQALIAGAPETVTSEARRAEDALLSRKFVTSLLQPSYNLEGQFSRWRKPVCPHVAGLAPAAAFVVERRIRDIARQIGAPVDARDPCKANIRIFVSPEPQATLDAIVAKDSLRLLARAGHELTMRYPVQAWYVGYFRDYDNIMRIDLPREDIAVRDDFPPMDLSKVGDTRPLMGDARPNLTRLHTGMLSEMSDATVIVDAKAIAGTTLGALADHLALMTLSQTPATGRCQPAPSIANLFLKDCEADYHVNALSDVDMAMLNALYRTPDQPENLQMTRLIGNMQRALEGETRK